MIREDLKLKLSLSLSLLIYIYFTGKRSLETVFLHHFLKVLALSVSQLMIIRLAACR